MNRIPCILALGCVLLASQLTGCKSVEPYDYSRYRLHPPRSIAVLPPLNESAVVAATYSYLSKLSAPLAEHGFYVFPVMVMDDLLKENGMPTPGEMHQVPLAKMAEITGADAVLFVTVQRYGPQYRLLNTSVQLEVAARLVDTRTETLLWEGHAAAQSNSYSLDDPVSSLISAAAAQIVASKTDTAHQLSDQVNFMLFHHVQTGLPYGPYRPEYIPLP